MELNSLDLFNRYFAEHRDKYVIIGGFACLLNLQDRKLKFRETKDLDVVLLLNTSGEQRFAEFFWNFVKAGNYQVKQRSSGKTVFFKFDKPQDWRYPSTLKIFSRHLDILENSRSTLCTPVAPDSNLTAAAKTFSADDYDEMIRKRHNVVRGMTVAAPECLTALYARAYLNLTEGETGDEDRANTFMDDVFRIAQLLKGKSIKAVPRHIGTDMKKFVDRVKSAPPDFNSLGITDTNADGMIELLSKVYGIE